MFPIHSPLDHTVYLWDGLCHPRLLGRLQRSIPKEAAAAKSRQASEDYIHEDDMANFRAASVASEVVLMEVAAVVEVRVEKVMAVAVAVDAMEAVSCPTTKSRLAQHGRHD